jgi:hypothetical protein
MEPRVTEPTGLDLHAAYAALYPGLVEQGVRIQDLSDRNLQMVDRAARLRRAERERVKNVFLELAKKLDDSGDVPGAGDNIRDKAEEIR